jgi:hypothetical protein
MKVKYIKPVITIVKIDKSTLLCVSSDTTIPDQKQHCSNCKWNPDGTEAWHCDHSKNPWTGKPFYPDCDFYN